MKNMMWMAFIISALTMPVRAAGTQLNINATNLVSFHAGIGGDMLVAGSNGQPLGQGRVHIGTFADGFDPGIAVTTLDYGSLIANFTAVVDGPVLTPDEWSNLGLPGVELNGFYYFDSMNLIWPESQVGRDLYLFIGNGSTLAASSELGLVRHFLRMSSASPPEFLLSNPIDFTNPAYFTGSLALTADTLSQGAGGEIILGSVGLHNMTDPYFFVFDGPMSTLQLVAIPETSTPLLLGIAAIALTGRRTRNPE